MFSGAGAGSGNRQQGQKRSGGMGGMPGGMGGMPGGMGGMPGGMGGMPGGMGGMPGGMGNIFGGMGGGIPGMGGGIPGMGGMNSGRQGRQQQQQQQQQQQPTAEAKIHDLTFSSFPLDPKKGSALQKESIWLVAFALPFQGESKKLMQSDLKKASQALYGHVKIGVVDCSGSEQSKCTEFVKSLQKPKQKAQFPSLVTFGYRKAIEPVLYTGALTSDAIISHGLKQVPDMYVHVLNNKQAVDESDGADSSKSSSKSSSSSSTSTSASTSQSKSINQLTLRQFNDKSAQGWGQIVFFSDKKSSSVSAVSATLKSLAKLFHQYFLFSVVFQDSVDQVENKASSGSQFISLADMKRELKVDQVPAVRLLYKDKRLRYKGELKLKPLLQFLDDTVKKLKMTKKVSLSS
jgi:hypothetical protein